MGSSNAKPLIPCAASRRSYRDKIPVMELPDDEMPTTSTFHDIWSCKFSESSFICYSCGKSKPTLLRLVQHIVKTRFSDELMAEVEQWIATEKEEFVYRLLRVLLFVDFPHMNHTFVSVVPSKKNDAGVSIVLVRLPHSFIYRRNRTGTIPDNCIIPTRYCSGVLSLEATALKIQAREEQQQQETLICPHCAHCFSSQVEFAFHLLLTYFPQSVVMEMAFQRENPLGLLVADPPLLLQEVHSCVQHHFDSSTLRATTFFPFRLPLHYGQHDTFDWLPSAAKDLSTLCIVLQPDDPMLEHYVLQRYQRSDAFTRCPCCGKLFPSRRSMVVHLVKSLYRLEKPPPPLPSFSPNTAMGLLKLLPRQFILSLNSEKWITAIFRQQLC